MRTERQLRAWQGEAGGWEGICKSCVLSLHASPVEALRRFQVGLLCVLNYCSGYGVQGTHGGW